MSAEQNVCRKASDSAHASPEHVVTSYDELQILNASDRCYMVGDWEKGRKKCFFGNKSACALFGVTPAFWTSMTFENQSEAMEIFQEEAFQNCQRKGEFFRHTKTSHVGGKARVLLHKFMPMLAKFPDWQQARRVFLMEVVDITTSDDEEALSRTGSADKAKVEADLNMAAELLEHSETYAMVFDSVTEKLEFGNVRSLAFYEDNLGHSLTCLDDMMSTFIWDDEGSRDEMTERVRSLKPGSPRVHFRSQVARTGTKELWHQVHIVPAYHPCKGDKPVLIVCQTDVTTMHKQSKQLLMLHQEAAQQQEQFFSAISHELRTPLNGIIGLSDSLIQSPDCSERMVKTLQLVKTSGMRLANLVNDILDTASTREGTFQIRCEKVVLQEVSESVCAIVAPLVPKQVTLTNTLSTQPLPHLEGDSNRLNQILCNLLGNAIKCTAAGSIVLSGRELSEEEIVVEVTDTGCGVPRDKWEQIFLPFRQVDMSTTRKLGGTGLGLSLVKELVEAHHGRMGMASSVVEGQRGTTMFFVLPVKQPGPSATPSHRGSVLLRRRELAPGVLMGPTLPTDPAFASGDLRRSRSAPHLDGMVATPEPAVVGGKAGDAELPQWEAALDVEDARRSGKSLSGEAAGGEARLKHHSELHGAFEILSIDDNLVSHVVVQNSLAPKGHVVTVCMSGLEASELLETRGFLPDLVLLDCAMPEMSGYEVAANLREKYPFNTLPVIMVSAKGREEDVVRGLEAGCNDYIRKPFGCNELSARIDVQFKLKYLWAVEMVRAVAVRTPERTPPRQGVGSDMILSHRDVTVLVCDLCDTLELLNSLLPDDFAHLVVSLHDRFDAIAHAWGLTRLVDDCYMLVLDHVTLQLENPGSTILRIASEMLDAASRVRVGGKHGRKAPRMRIGLARGTARSGVVGIKLTQYAYFGPAVRAAVDTAHRCPPGCVAVEEGMQRQLEDAEAVVALRTCGGAHARHTVYLAKTGLYQEALDEHASGGDGGGGGEGGPAPPGPLDPMNHLRAFLRLSSVSLGCELEADDAKRGREPRSTRLPSDDCGACNWERKYKALKGEFRALNREPRRAKTIEFEPGKPVRSKVSILAQEDDPAQVFNDLMESALHGKRDLGIARVVSKAMAC